MPGSTKIIPPCTCKSLKENTRVQKVIDSGESHWDTIVFNCRNQHCCCFDPENGTCDPKSFDPCKDCPNPWNSVKNSFS